MTRPTTSPGKASSRVSRSRPKAVWAYLVAKGLPVLSWVTVMPRSKRPEHTRKKAMRSRWDGSMLAWTLKTKPAKGASRGRGTPSSPVRGVGDGTRSTTASSSMPTPKLVSAEPKKTGVASAARKALGSSSGTMTSSRSSSSWAVTQASPSSSAARSAGTCSSGAIVEPWLVRVKRVKPPSPARWATPRKSPDRPTGQVTGVGVRPICFSISSISSMASRPGRSHLLMKLSSGRPRSRQTSNSLRVWGSMPLAASSTMIAASAAARTR